MKHINIEEFAGGALTAQINRAIEDITRNIQDPNTDATATRKITVTITFKPAESRSLTPAGIQTKLALAPSLGAATVISMGRDLKTGEVEAVEIGNQIPGQVTMKEMIEQEEEDQMEQSVDPSTGEIYETPKSSVIDLRARHAQ